MDTALILQRMAWPRGWRDFRNRWLASPRFQRWAAGFPLTRRVARRRASELFDLCAGFVYSQVLLACVRLRVFQLLGDGALGIAALAGCIDVPLAATQRLVDAAVSLRLLEWRAEGRVALGPHGAALLGNPAVLAMIEHHTMLYADLSDPVALLRGNAPVTELSRYWSYATSEQPQALAGDQVARYSALMSASQGLVTEEILDAYSFGRHRRLLDVGGGGGGFVVTVSKRYPQLNCTLLDLPAVAEIARQRFEAAGLGTRAQAVGGNFFTTPLPQGSDVISLIRVLHDHDDAPVLALLRNVKQALAPGGTLLIAEPLAATAGAAAMGDAYFGLYLFAMGSGRPRSLDSLERLLREAGFVRVHLLPTRQPLQASLIAAMC